MGHPLRALAIGNVVVALLAVLWAYASYVYNWLNVGGGSGNVDLWIWVNEVTAYAALSAWGIVIVLATVVGRRLGSLSPWAVLGAVASGIIGPAVFFAADGLFHLGFPSPQV